MFELKDYNVFAGDLQILKDINIKFAPGVHVIMGPNGSGKSTLAQSIMDHHDYRSEGVIDFDGHLLHKIPTHERARKGLFVSEQTPIELLGISNFGLILRVFESRGITVSIKEQLKLYKEKSAELGLPIGWDKRDLNVDASGGEKKKNELMQIAMFGPDVIILDEPDSGLDVDATKLLYNDIVKLKDLGKTVIVISHQRQLVEALDLMQVIVLKDGEIVERGTTATATRIFDNGFN